MPFVRRLALPVAAVVLLASPALAASPVTRLHVGDEFIASGQTGSLAGHKKRATGLVVIRGSWNGGPLSGVGMTKSSPVLVAVGNSPVTVFWFWSCRRRG